MLDEIVRAAAILDRDQLLALVAARKGADESVLGGAWSEVKTALEVTGLEKEFDRFRNDLVAWARDGRMWRGDEMRGRIDEMELSDLRTEALPALLDAAAALLLADRLDAGTRAVLLGSWESVTIARPAILE